jgi:hypothetical protein
MHVNQRLWPIRNVIANHVAQREPIGSSLMHPNFRRLPKHPELGRPLAPGIADGMKTFTAGSYSRWRAPAGF